MAAATVLYKRNNTLSDTNKTLTTRVGELETDIKVYQAAEQALILGQALADGDKEAFQKLVTQSRNKLLAEEARIKREISDPLEQMQQLSKARMGSVWENFCNAQPSNAKCVKMAQTASTQAAEGVKK